MLVTYTSLFDLFKIGLGPSSSHTVGPMLAARRFAHSAPSRVTVSLFGSLAMTGPGHGTARAVILGLQGHDPATVPIEADSVGSWKASRVSQAPQSGQRPIHLG